MSRGGKIVNKESHINGRQKIVETYCSSESHSLHSLSHNEPWAVHLSLPQSRCPLLPTWFSRASLFQFLLSLVTFQPWYSKACCGDWNLSLQIPEQFTAWAFICKGKNCPCQGADGEKNILESPR